MHWAALLINPQSDSSPVTEAAGVALWALQFTPRVAYRDEAVVLELEQSLRLFGGEALVHTCVESGGIELGVKFIAWAPTSLAALALARAGINNGFEQPIARMLDPLPFEHLSAVGAHAGTLSRLGCKTLADVRKLPRGGISRRFDKELLRALDQAYGLSPEVHDWVAVPESFAVRLELPGRVETSAGLLFGARRLLLQMGGWLGARHAGVTAFKLRWSHDAMRARDAGDGGEITIRTAEPTQNVDHLCRLLAEHLAKVQLLAPASDIEISATDVTPIVERSHSLLPDTVRQGESLLLVLERIEARLGKKRVLRPTLVEDHRPEWMQRWQASATVRPNVTARQTQVPQPAWILRKPMQLAIVKNRPIYQGPLQLVLGPDRVEGGWWHRSAHEEVCRHLNVERDYWVALSSHAGTLWIFQERLALDETAWYLHGHFA